MQTTTLIVAFGLIVQGYAVWKLRRGLRLSRLLPFVLGGLIGIPVGVELLRWTPAAYLRIAVGILLVLFSIYSLARPQLRRIAAGGRVADGGVGFLELDSRRHDRLRRHSADDLVLGVRGWPKDEQRAVFQPTGVAIFLGTALLLGGSGTVTPDTVRLFLIGLPALLLGSWVGLRLYGRLDEAGFRKVVLLLLLVSGIALIAPILFVT